MVTSLLPVLLSQGGCYSTTADWTVNNVQRPTATQSMPYGTGLSVVREPASDDTLAVHVDEVALCRSYESGTAYTERSRTLMQNHWPFILGTVVGVLGLAATVTGGVLKATESSGTSLCLQGGRPVDCTASSPATPVLVGGVLGLAAAAGLIVPWAIMPSSRAQKEEEKVGPYKKWREAPVACSPAQPIGRPTEVTLDLKNEDSKATIATWTLPTDATGHYRNTALASAQRIASYCGTSALFVSDASHAVEKSDTPDAPQILSGRHGDAIRIAVPQSATRATLAAMEKEDPTAASLARTCCADTVKRDTEPKCVARCLEAAGATKCLNGMRGCEVQAKTGEFVEDGLAKCGSLLSVCLAAHGSGASQLLACKSMCATKNASEVCK